MSEQQSKQISSLEKLLLNDANAFKEDADIDLQKQIMATVERESKEASSTSSHKVAELAPLNVKKLAWWFTGMSVAAIAGFLSIILIPQMIMKQDHVLTTQQFTVTDKLKNLGENIQTIETASITKMTTEKDALKKDIKNLIKAFSINKDRV